MELDFSVVRTKDELMDWMGKNFSFPSFWGENWDAVEECLHDYCLSDVTIETINESEMEEEMVEEMAIFQQIVDDFNQSEEAQITFA